MKVTMHGPLRDLDKSLTVTQKSVHYSALPQVTMCFCGKRVAIKRPHRYAGALGLLHVLPANRHFLRADERTRTAYPCSSYEFACARSSLSWCVRNLPLFRRFSADLGVSLCPLCTSAYQPGCSTGCSTFVVGNSCSA